MGIKADVVNGGKEIAEERRPEVNEGVGEDKARRDWRLTIEMKILAGHVKAK